MSHIAQGLFQPSQLLCERYRVVELLGGGEKTEVYKVHDTLRNKLLALKVLREVKGKNDELTLRREFYYLSKLYHPRVVTVYDFGITPERKPYFTMEYVPGMPITRYFSGKFNPDLIEVITQLLRALDYIHSQGLLHCDLKPQHILVFEDNGKPQTKLLDFGFAERREFSKNVSARGTLGYIAPEVFKGVDTDVRADLYSLGVVLYETLTGITPGEGKDIYDWLRKQYTSGFLPPRKFNPEIPEEL
ncbi:MAG: serine/threonine-protein kinase, partial [candidate division WOR-3 bacterium]